MARLTWRPFSFAVRSGERERVDPPDARLYVWSTHCASLRASPKASRIHARLVMKFGGTSVADLTRIRIVAAHVKREIDAGSEVAVVVSAMAGRTDELVAWCKEAGSYFDNPEYNSVVASGELVTAGLLALVLKDMGLKARSWAGWQIPLATDGAHGSARIAGVDGTRLIEGFAAGEIAVVAGFQGVHKATNRVTTLGRGGSDTSAVRWPPRSHPTVAISIRTSTASTRPTRALCREPAGSIKCRSRKCWKWLRSAPRCCRCARWKWPW